MRMYVENLMTSIIKERKNIILVRNPHDSEIYNTERPWVYTQSCLKKPDWGPLVNLFLCVGGEIGSFLE